MWFTEIPTAWKFYVLLKVFGTAAWSVGEHYVNKFSQINERYFMKIVYLVYNISSTALSANNFCI